MSKKRMSFSRFGGGGIEAAMGSGGSSGASRVAPDGSRRGESGMYTHSDMSGPTWRTIRRDKNGCIILVKKKKRLPRMHTEQRDRIKTEHEIWKKKSSLER